MKPFLFSSLLLLGACNAPGPSRLFVLGIDGLDPDAVELLIAEGKMPNFEALKRNGASGRLLSQEPMLSPLIWTTIATGKPPLEHGITHFVARDQQGREIPVSSNLRQVKALWNMFSDLDASVAIVGWWATWPAEAVMGQVVSDRVTYHFLMNPSSEQAHSTDLLTFPQGLLPELDAFVVSPNDVDYEMWSRFTSLPEEQFRGEFAFADELGHLRWALAAAETHIQVARHLWQKENPRLLMTYVEGVDSMSHLFGHHFRKGNEGPFSQTVEKMYRFVDQKLGDILEQLDDKTTLIVLSDHGFNLGTGTNHKDHHVSADQHALEGVIFLYGNQIKPNQRLIDSTILDVTPTILALAGLPIAEDMPGNVLKDAFRKQPQVLKIDSYLEMPTSPLLKGDDAINEAMLERLMSLGYIGKPSLEAEMNRASLMIQNGNPQNAISLLEKLIHQHPNHVPLLVNLGSAYAQAGDERQARWVLETALALNPSVQVYHNLGVLEEQQGNLEQAVHSFLKALKFDPQYQPSLNSLKLICQKLRAEDPDLIRNIAASRMKEPVNLAKKGQLDLAKKELELILCIDPSFGELHRNIANIEYLLGNLDEAWISLKKAIALIPGDKRIIKNIQALELEMEKMSNSK